MGEAIWSESAYHDAIARNIKRNAFKTFTRTYPRAEEVAQFLGGHLPDSKKGPQNFLESMAAVLLNKFGKLTAGQYEAVCKIIDDRAAKVAQHQQALDNQQARLQELGIKSERLDFTVTLEKLLSFKVPAPEWESDTMLVYIFRDDAGQKIVCKTKTVLGWEEELEGRTDFRKIGEGDHLQLKATVKCREEYKGEKQTVVQRAKVVCVLEEAQNG